MSFYYKHGFSFSYHGLQRVKERLNMKEQEDFKVKDEAMKLIKMSRSSFETSRNVYIQAGNKEVFFVIDKKTNLIVTATPISASKQLWLLENE